MRLYLETSALLRAAILEQHEVIRRMESVENWVTSSLTLVECERSLVAMLHRRQISRSMRAKAHGYLREVVWHTEVSELEGILDRAGQPFPVEPVRALDGLHLAAILGWAELGPVEVLTCDSRVKQNAEALGLAVSYFPEEPAV